jgi:hypothetical protein
LRNSEWKRSWLNFGYYLVLPLKDSVNRWKPPVRSEGVLVHAV